MDNLKIRRGRVKGALTRIYHFACDFPENTSPMDIDRKRQKADELWAEYHTIDNAMIDASTDPNTMTSDADLEENYYRTMQLLDKKITEISLPEPALNNSNSTSNSTNANNSFNETLSFSGDLTEWDTIFSEPANLLTHISVTDNNYAEAWEKLKKRYDKKGHIANALINKFVYLSNSSQSNYASLRKLVDGADEIIRGLRALGPHAETRDIWLIHLLLAKLDSETQNAWSKIISENQFPTFTEFFVFLEKRCDILSTRPGNKIVKSSASTPIRTSHNSINFRNFHTTTNFPNSHGANNNAPSCIKCHAYHELHQCAQFATMFPQLRRSFAQTNSLCFNCLRAGHRSTICRSIHSCKQCHNRHHSLLHSTPNFTRSPSQLVSSSSSRQQTPQTPRSSIGSPVETSTPIISNHSLVHSKKNAHFTHSTNMTHTQTYLPTAVVNTQDKFGTTHSIRVLIDTGSQCSFISEECVQGLGLARSHAKIPILGLSSTGAGTTRGSVTLTLLSRFSDNSLTLTAYVMSKLTNLLPNFIGTQTEYNSHNLIKFADPDYNQPGPIDIIIGADKAFLILENEVLKGSPGSPSAILIIFGWVIAGETSIQDMASESCSLISSLHTTLNNDFDLKRFWELEEIDAHSQLSEEEQNTESHFETTHSKSSDGKYIVELPFKKGNWKFGNTLSAAIARQKSMERKFIQNPTLKQQYADFMTEYISLGHMSQIPPTELHTQMCCYLPHHAVFKEASSTTKLRVVFDRSSKSGNEISLNETLCIGPPIQRDLFGVCTRFRRHKYCFSADIQQMFRQIWIAEKHRYFQRIIWRDNVAKPFTHYRLNTVTYGTSPAPFLSVRTLQQLAKDNEIMYPDIATIILKDFYVDDILSGADTVEGIADMKNKLTRVLASAGFNLRKWSSNCLPFLMSIPEEQREISSLKFQD